jgi:small-conductance mechanosensitive channel
MTLSFGVAWYDMEFFNSKKDVFKDPNHSVIFSKFGKVPMDFDVQHFVAE